MTQAIFYVYRYLTEDGTPYYIGKGKGNRIHAPHKHVTVPALHCRELICTDLTEADALQIEMQLIRKYGRKLDGGVLDNIKLNQWACTSGWHHSAETKIKISESNLGKVRSAEAIKNYSKPKSIQHANKIRKANIGLTKSMETKQKISETKKGTIPWNKGITGTSWSDTRRAAYLNNKAKEI
jgi:hypothetical protein